MGLTAKTKRRVTVALILSAALSLAGVMAGAQGGDASSDYFRRLINDALALEEAGRYAEAIPLMERVVSEAERERGSEDHVVAALLDRLGRLHHQAGDYAEAELIFKRSLAMWEVARGGDHPEVTIALNSLGLLYQDAGDYGRSIQLLERALAILENAPEPNPREIATTLNNLGRSYQGRGDLVGALSLLERAVAIDEKVLGPEHPGFATELNNLAELYRAMGNYRMALPLYHRTLKILENKFGQVNPQVATVLNNLALLHIAERDYEQALELMEHALAIDEELLGPEHPNVGIDLSHIAAVYREQRDFRKALPLLERALAMHEKKLGPEHYLVAEDLNNLANVYMDQGDSTRALPLLQRALAILERALGPKHPDVATMLGNLGMFYRALGDLGEAQRLLERSVEARESNLAAVLVAGSQLQKQSYLDTITNETYGIISFHTQDASRDAGAARMAMTTILRRKGRTLDAFAGQVAALRQRAAPEDRELLEQLAAARAKSARLSLEQKGTDPEVERLEAEAERLEDTISRRSAEFKAIVQPVTIEGVADAIPVDAALVEIMAYVSIKAKAKGADEQFGGWRYVAYVLRQGEAPPQFVDLGDAPAIDEEAARFYAAVMNPRSTEAQAAGRALDESVFRPIRKLLGPTRRIFLSPDGLLSMVPFAALVDENGKFLVEDYSLTYLTSGRDLLRLQSPSEKGHPPAVFADPLYDMAAEGGAVHPAARPEENQRLPLPESGDFKPLPGTAEEAAALARLWPDARILTRGEATESAVKQVESPLILHVATHGFFLPDETPEAHAAPTTAVRETFDTLPLPSARPAQRQREDSLLRSGLVLAGVKQHRSGPGEDGVLTALETAELNLWGTKLVVLSACETGLGYVKHGAGVYGLRRALVLAGSQTQVMSLWKVSDTGARDLMMAYYGRLKAGEGRTDALRQVQLEMLRGKLSSAEGGADYRHPYYWAAFIPSGDWRSMDGGEGPLARLLINPWLITMLSLAVGGLILLFARRRWRSATLRAASKQSAGH